jgi:hypothetical protein
MSSILPYLINIYLRAFNIAYDLSTYILELNDLKSFHLAEECTLGSISHSILPILTC